MTRRGSVDPRTRELGLIHIAIKQLGLDDAAYRDLLWVLARVRSARDLDEHGRRMVIEHLRGRGFRPRVPRPRPAPDKERQVAKIRALLIEADRPDAYADALAQRMFDVDRYDWLDPKQLGGVITALVKDAARHGRRTR